MTTAGVYFYRAWQVVLERPLPDDLIARGLDWAPRIGQRSACCFEWLLGVLILKLDRTEIAQY